MCGCLLSHITSRHRTGCPEKRTNKFAQASLCTFNKAIYMQMRGRICGCRMFESNGENGCSSLTKYICGMSFLGNRFELVVSPAVLPVAVPCVLHHLVSHRYKRELVSLVNIKQDLISVWAANTTDVPTGVKNLIIMKWRRNLVLHDILVAYPFTPSDKGGPVWASLISCNNSHLKQLIECGAFLQCAVMRFRKLVIGENTQALMTQLENLQSKTLFPQLLWL